MLGDIVHFECIELPMINVFKNITDMLLLHFVQRPLFNLFRGWCG
uniref:Uncharacterized protein n=1 Tax=Anguilla anguilla TaxID=7936 RepID=A0A0E9QRN7_ANGAN